jgi:serine/threonine-protein kinase
MATVYLATDRKHERPVAVKVLHPELAAALGAERFLREIKLTGRLNHPHILPLLDSGEAGGFLFYVMPYVEGESLRDRLDREKQLPIDDALQISREVADALSYAHSHDVVHRDIKPENILLSAGHAVVADFGIARAITAAGGSRLTETGMAIGTPMYMSPEQAAGSKELDGRSDLYSLGCVLFEMLAGQPPFTGPTAESVIRQHMAVDPPAVTNLRPAVPASVVAALARALAKTPADRFNPVAQFGEALGEGGPGSGGRGDRGTGGPKPTGLVGPTVPRSLRPALFGVAAVVVVGGALLVFRLGRGPRAPAAPAYARTAIAVLPLENLSTEPAYAYFAPGLHDELLTQLSRVAALKVISRTSVAGYAHTTKPLREIARELGVGSVVEGSVQVVGGRLRVSVQLIDAATDEHLWAEHYDRRLDDAFAIQSDVAQRIVAAVGAALSGVELEGLAAAPTANAEAYRLYLQGLEYASRGLRQGTEIALGLYERALALDPGFALAHVALSTVHGTMYWQSFDPSPARAARQRAEAEAALRLAPDLAQAHFAMGLAHYWGRRDYRRALGEFAIALEGLPNNAGVWNIIGAVHRRLGDWNEAITAYEKAAQLDPRSVGLIDQFAETYYVMHRYAEAVRKYDQALSLAPDFHIAATNRAWAYVSWQGRLDTLRAALGRLPRDVDLGGLGTPAGAHVQLLLWERRPDSLLQGLQIARERVFEGQRFFLPASLYAAWAHQLRHDNPAAHAAFDSARVLLDSVIRGLPGDWRVHAGRGLALAGLGHRDEALREARWLAGSEVYREDALDGSAVALHRAWILAQVGEPNAALDEIERMLSRPSRITVYWLRLDPLWDPIREHPRFKALLARYAGR